MCWALALDNNNEGTWSINCPDNPDRKDGLKKLAASGSISIESKNLIGLGYDTNNNKVKFYLILNIRMNRRKFITLSALGCCSLFLPSCKTNPLLIENNY